jgi:hypothetical protein
VIYCVRLSAALYGVHRCDAVILLIPGEILVPVLFPT